MIKLKTIVNEVLLESLSSAKKKYLDTKLIDQATFDKLKAFDPTPTFKYLEKIVEFYLESNPTNLEQVFADYHHLHTKNQVKTRDINKFKSFSDLSKEVEDVIKTYSQKTATKVKSKDAEVVFENDKWLVIIPRTFEASCKYGSGTKWCTTMAGGKHYRSYTQKGITLYYVISKKNPDDEQYGKMGVAVYPNGKTIECFNARDKPIGFDEVLERTGLDKNLFKSKPNELTIYDKLGLDESKITHNPDGSIDYDGDVFLDNNAFVRATGKIPIKFRKVTGSFFCSSIKLTTLKNCPQEVGRSFDCSHNELTTLEYAPKKVGGYFNCSNNKLTTLEYAPVEVSGMFDCSYNKLKTLEHSPKKVGGRFVCMNTPSLPESEKKWAEENIEAKKFVWG